MQTHILIHANNSQVLIQSLKLANSFWSRFKGLMLTAPLPNNEGILISQCKQVHTHFMRYAIDVYFLDKQMTVIEKLDNVKPWRFTRYYKNAYYVLETMPEAIQTVHIGDTLSVKS